MIYIIIPVHNRLDATRECLESLRKQTCGDFKVVLVDDGSTDGTSDFINENYPEVILLKGDGSLWWTGATNLGVEHVLQYAREKDHILTLNNDTFVPPDYIATLVSLAQKEPNALIGSIAFDYNRRDVPVSEGVRIDWLSAKYTKIKHSPDAQPQSFYPVTVLSGRGTLIPARVFRQIGSYDAENFPHYAADYDLSLRAHHQGHPLLLHPACYLFARTDLTGISNVHAKISFSAWLKSFGSIKSSNNLKIRLKFGLRHPPLLFRPIFILCDLCRVFLGTFRNQMRNGAKS